MLTFDLWGLAMKRKRYAALILLLFAAGFVTGCDLFGKAETPATYHKVNASIEVKTLEAAQ